MHYVSIILLTLTFIQGHTDLNHENKKYLIISESTQPMPIKFAGKIVRLNFDVTIASPVTLIFVPGHKCVSSVTTF